MLTYEVTVKPYWKIFKEVCIYWLFDEAEVAHLKLWIITEDTWDECYANNMPVFFKRWKGHWWALDLRSFDDVRNGTIVDPPEGYDWRSDDDYLLKTAKTIFSQRELCDDDWNGDLKKKTISRMIDIYNFYKGKLRGNAMISHAYVHELFRRNKFATFMYQHAQVHLHEYTDDEDVKRVKFITSDFQRSNEALALWAYLKRIKTPSLTTHTFSSEPSYDRLRVGDALLMETVDTDSYYIGEVIKGLLQSCNN